MNSKSLLSDDMTLDEKLAAIDAMMATAVLQAQQNVGSSGQTVSVVADPADLTMCLGCQ